MQQSVLVGLLFLAAIVVAGCGIYVALAVRRWARTDEPAAEPFTLQDLRDLRARGEITEREFQVLRAEMIGAVRGAKDEGTDSGGD